MIVLNSTGMISLQLSLAESKTTLKGRTHILQKTKHPYFLAPEASKFDNHLQINTVNRMFFCIILESLKKLNKNTVLHIENLLAKFLQLLFQTQQN